MFAGSNIHHEANAFLMELMKCRANYCISSLNAKLNAFGNMFDINSDVTAHPVIMQ